MCSSDLGDPNTSPAYQQALEALYAVAYKLKFTSKKSGGGDYVVPPLEGMWWAEDVKVFQAGGDRSLWLWTMMIMQPAWITEAMLQAAKEEVSRSKALPALPTLRLESYHEGLAVQTLHVGPYDAEGPVLKELHAVYLPRNGWIENGKHHEIYLGDPRRTAPERLKTILRQPVRPA